MPALPFPFEFVLFALTLIGVAIFHHHVLKVALAGLAAITLYKLGFSSFKGVAGVGGLGALLGARVGDHRKSVPASDWLRAALASLRRKPRPGRDARRAARQLVGRGRVAGD